MQCARPSQWHHGTVRHLSQEAHKGLHGGNFVNINPFRLFPASKLYCLPAQLLHNHDHVSETHGATLL